MTSLPVPDVCENACVELLELNLGDELDSPLECEDHGSDDDDL